VSNYSDRLTEKAYRLRNAADKARAESESRHRSAQQIMSFIPPGQPILVGHHSEKRHRRDLDKIDNNMRAAVDADKRAQALANSAENAENRSDYAIDSDDPDAVEKIGERIEELRTEHERGKALNKAYKASGYAHTGEVEKIEKFAELAGCSVEEAREIVADCDKWKEVPCPSYRMSNRSANIRRLVKRKEQLEALGVSDDAEDETRDYGKITVTVSRSNGRVFFDTPGRNEKASAILKNNGWRWARSRSCWSRKLTANAICAAKYIADNVAECYDA